MIQTGTKATAQGQPMLSSARIARSSGIATRKSSSVSQSTAQKAAWPCEVSAHAGIPMLAIASTDLTPCSPYAS